MAAPVRGGFLSLFASAALAAVAVGPRVARAQAQVVEWEGVERVIAFADVHGADAELRTLLRESGVVDAQDRWAAGGAHVVSLGDLLDRGAGSRQVLDLLMRLQEEARTAGGRLHVLLGNHEAMNLLGDLRYVDAREYAAYTDLESPAEREEARRAGPRVAPRPVRPSTSDSRRGTLDAARRSRPMAATADGCSACRWRSASMTRCSCMADWAPC